MIRATGIKEEGQPYLTKIEDQNGKTMVVNSSVKQSEYLSPSQLLQAGLAGCMSMTVKGALFRAGLQYHDVAVTVDMISEEDGTYTFTYQVDVNSDDDPAAVKKVADEAAEKCYVRNILASGPKLRRVK